MQVIDNTSHVLYTCLLGGGNRQCKFLKKLGDSHCCTKDSPMFIHNEKEQKEQYESGDNCNGYINKMNEITNQKLKKTA